MSSSEEDIDKDIVNQKPNTINSYPCQKSDTSFLHHIYIHRGQH